MYVSSSFYILYKNMSYIFLFPNFAYTIIVNCEGCISENFEPHNISLVAYCAINNFVPIKWVRFIILIRTEEATWLTGEFRKLHFGELWTSPHIPRSVEATWLLSFRKPLIAAGDPSQGRDQKNDKLQKRIYLCGCIFIAAIESLRICKNIFKVSYSFSKRFFGHLNFE